MCTVWSMQVQPFCWSWLTPPLKGVRSCKTGDHLFHLEQSHLPTTYLLALDYTWAWRYLLWVVKSSRPFSLKQSLLSKLTTFLPDSKCTVVGILFCNWLILNYYKWVTNWFFLLSHVAEQFLRYAFEKFNFTRLVFGNSTFSQKILMVKVTKYLVTNLEMSKKNNKNK